MPWFHHVEIITKCKTLDEALFYIHRTIAEDWSRNTLIHQIKADLYGKHGKAVTNFSEQLPEEQAVLAQEMTKENYDFGFITLPKNFGEKDLEDALCEQITQFLLELGNGFSFVGRQKEIIVDGVSRRIDMLFYHLRLHCYVVVELKACRFQPEFAGKLNFYVNAVDDLLKTDIDRPTIGLLICSDYEHWTAIKYKRCPPTFTPKDLWTAIVADRMVHRQNVWPRYGVHFALTNRMQRLCHEFDMDFGGSWCNDSIIQDSHRERYLVSSRMEEAISSSQMEGASTTRRVAKDMLRKSFLFAEAEGNDIGYFIAYNLRVLNIAFQELQRYLDRKKMERRAAHSFMRLGNINERQAEIIRLFCDNPKGIVSVKDLEARFHISRNTARFDVAGLVDMGILSEVHLNKKKSVYIRADGFDEKIS